MPTKKLLLTFAFMVLVFSSTGWAMDDCLSDIESHIYKIKSKSSGSCLSVGTSVADKNSASMQMDVQDEHASYQLWYFEKAGEFYKIKSKSSGNCLSSTFETDRGGAFMVVDSQDEQENNRLWYFEKTGEFYKIKNKFSRTSLSSVFETTHGSAFLAVDTQDEHANYRLWYFEKARELDKIKNKSSAKCLDCCESEKDNRRESAQGEQAKHNISYVGGCGPCAPIANTYATGQRDNAETEIDRYTLFSSSFLSGAVYSLVPEMVRDALESRGYPRASAIAIIVQGGMIVYSSPSYFAPIAGMAVRIGCSQLEFSPQVATTAGSTVAVVISLLEKLIFSQETILDSVVDVAIGFSGSCAGSILILKGKSWAYGLWRGNKTTIVCEKPCQPHGNAC